MMNIRQRQIEEQIFCMIDEIRDLKRRINNTFNTRNVGKTALINYFHIKLGMCLSLIDTYRSEYPLSLVILQWYKDNIEVYTSLRKYIYTR